MKIHEYQARDLLGKAGIPVPPATVVDNPEAAGAAFKANGAPLQVVKAQVFAGGRGKAGFVKLVKTADEADFFELSEAFARNIVMIGAIRRTS